jgi:hypothetical protein
MATTKKATTKAKKATHHEPDLPTQDEPTTPAISQVLPGGGVAVGAVLHVRTPVPAAGNATDAPTTPKATEEDLAELASLRPADVPPEYDFTSPTSVPLVEGGYASVSKVKVIDSEPGHVVVEVVR